MTFRNGLESLLRPEDSVLVLIDHQPYQLANLNSHDPHSVVNLTTALAKLAKAFNVPTILTSVIAGRGGLLFKQITDVFPGQEVIDRTWVNTWQDEKVVDAVKATGRKQLIIAGLWTEVCVAMPVIQAAGEGWDVTVITDASGGISKESHEVAVQRMIAAGANPMTVMALAGEWQSSTSPAAASPIFGSSNSSRLPSRPTRADRGDERVSAKRAAEDRWQVDARHLYAVAQTRET
jgi:nicotinamidase-related amidase